MAVVAPVGAAAFNPASTSTAHDAMKDRLWELDCVWGGTESLRAAGEKMLPRYERESVEDHRARLKGARLRRNLFRQAVERTAGRIFEVPVKMTDAPEGSAAWTLADDADLRGNSFDRVARDFAIGALRRGMAHILVDYPVVKARNLLEERQANARPYLVPLSPDQILECYEDDLGAIQYLRWYDRQLSWDKEARAVVLTERVQERIPGAYTVWKQVSEAVKVNSSMLPGVVRQAWMIDQEGTIAQDRIMFHTLYAEREDFLIARTPLTEVKDLTADHWEINSDLKNCLQRVLFPILTVVGIDAKEVGTLEVGPKSILGSQNKDAKFEYLEHTGKAIEAGEKYLEALEAAAEAYGGALTKPSGDVKATATATATSEATSWAKDFAVTLMDRLQAIVDDCALWMPAIGTPRVVVNLDFAVDLPDGDLTELGSMRRAGDLDRENYYLEMMRRNVLRSDFVPEEAIAALEEEDAESMKRETEMMKQAAAISAPREPGEPAPPAS
jgi:hypothetical protein